MAVENGVEGAERVFEREKKKSEWREKEIGLFINLDFDLG